LANEVTAPKRRGQKKKTNKIAYPHFREQRQEEKPGLDL
jgi:hypothetical protein